jgi:hypothetical protein
MDTGSSWITSAGHASIYLSRVCPESPVKVRLCAPGEQGSVLSNYADFHESKPFEWNIAPVSVFLYGVDDPADRPLFASAALQATLREHYRVTRLGPLCTSDDCRENPDANWTDMVGATFVRTIYIFEVKTTLAQDEELIRRLNASANVNHYSGTRLNCADFAKDILNSYFPHAVHSNRLNDFGMTSPKAVARSLTHFADHHKALELRVTRFAQLPSDIRRSNPARIGTETLFTTKKFLVPMLLRPEELAVFSASYLMTGRFSAEHAVRRHHPDPELQEVQLAGDPGPHDTPWKSWSDYQAAMARQEDEARELGVISDDSQLAHSFSTLEKDGVPALDSEGRPWIELAAQQNGHIVGERVGLTVSSVEKSPDEAAARLAYRYQLARVRFYLHSKGMDRESLPEFQQDWAILQAARRSVVNGEYDGPSSVTAENGVSQGMQPTVPSRLRGQ